MAGPGERVAHTRDARAGASGQHLARRRSKELAVHAMELRVAAEAGLERCVEQVDRTSRARHRVKEAIDPAPVAIVDERQAHLSLERPSEVAGAHAQLHRELLA